MGASRTSMALRGLCVTVALVTAAALIVAGSAGAFNSATTITCLVPPSAGPVQPNTPVRYAGVRVGTVSDVVANSDGARLTVEMRDGMLGQVPAGVRGSLLPRTVFGDEYLSLAVPTGKETAGELTAGSVVRANTSTRTVRLYTAYNRLYDFVSAMHPAEIRMALETVSDVLRGRGAEIGKMIDKAAKLGNDVAPMLDGLGDDLRAVAELARGLADAAPDMLTALGDAVALSETVVEERDTIHALLTSGSALAGQAQRSLSTNGGRIIELVHAADRVADVLARHPDSISRSMAAADSFLDKGISAFSTGRFKINAALSLDHPYPYTAQDCPRYPGNPGPNCGKSTPERQRSTEDSSQQQQAPRPPGGTAGAVGSAAEDSKLRELGSLLPDTGKSSEPDVDLLGILLGPLARGQQVMVP